MGVDIASVLTTIFPPTDNDVFLLPMAFQLIQLHTDARKTLMFLRRLIPPPQVINPLFSQQMSPTHSHSRTQVLELWLDTEAKSLTVNE